MFQALTFFFFLLGAWEKMIYLKLFFDQWLIQLRDEPYQQKSFGVWFEKESYKKHLYLAIIQMGCKNENSDENS